MKVRLNLGVVLAQRKRKLIELASDIGISVQNLSTLRSGRARQSGFRRLR
jgi:DNA-binding Xre family transcriptional regulator